MEYCADVCINRSDNLYQTNSLKDTNYQTPLRTGYPEGSCIY